MADHQDDVILVKLDYIQTAVDGINARLDAQNGRVRTVEMDVAVLKDRADENKHAGRNWGAGAGTVGGLLGGFLAGLLGMGGK